MKKTLLTFYLLCLAIISYSQIVISEIMYNPPESGSDSLEFIEVYNNSSEAINLNGYSFTDAVVFTFPDYTLEAGNYVVSAVNPDALNNVFGIASFQWESGGLRNSGEIITLVNAGGDTISQLTYSPDSPWPEDANGGGSSLELCDLNGDESDPANWRASSNGIGTIIEGAEVKATPTAENSESCVAMADVTVDVANFSFSPKDITIDLGETVMWVNKGGTHNVNGSMETYPDNPESFGSGDPSSSGWTYSFTFNTPGIYDYRCDPHASQGMVGTVTVLDPNDQVPPLVITEIMYNDPAMFDSLEFIEIYNDGDFTINLQGITFLSGVEHTFTEIMLASGDFIVVGQDSASLFKYFGIQAMQYSGDGLSSDGEEIVLATASGDTIDVVSYTDRSPWPLEADGGGYSLILCDLEGDNNDPANWQIATYPAIEDYAGQQIFADPGRVPYCYFPNGEASMVDNDGVAVMENRRVALDGTVYGINFRPGALQFTIIDNENEGIAVFSSNENYSYEPTEGDSIRLFGRIDQFNGLTQIVPDTLIIYGQGASLFSPTVVTTMGEETESQLITIENVMLLDPSEWQTSGFGFNVEVSNGTDTFTVRIDGDVDIMGMAYPTGTFNITGLGGQYDTSNPYLSGYQLFPRYQEDISPYNIFVEEFPERTIAEMTSVNENGVADSLTRQCTLEGLVYGINLRPSGLQFTLIDQDNNGIGVFNNTGDLGYTVQEGDRIKVKGTIAQFRGLTQIEPEEIELVSTANTLIDPTVTSELGEEEESSLIKIEGLTYVDPTDWSGDGTSFNVEVTNDGGNTVFLMRIDNDTELSTIEAPMAPFNLIGIGGQFDSDEPLTEGYQIFPRYLSDFEATSNTQELLDEELIKVYPNPVIDRLMVETDISVSRIEIIDISGKLILVSQRNNLYVDSLTQGIYFVRVTTEEGSWIEKVIKK